MYARLVQSVIAVLFVAGACTTAPSRPPTATALATTARLTSIPTASLLVPISVSAAVHVIRSELAPRIAATGVWTGTDLIVWGGWHWDGTGVAGPLGDGAAYDPAVNDWRVLPDAPIDAAKHLAVWHDREMLIWGGFTSDETAPSAGVAYNPSTGQWRTLAASPVKWAEGAASAWADGEWVIANVRHRAEDIEVVAYDPKLDQWRNLPGLPGPISAENQLVWTGSELLLVNVADGLFRLDPEKQAWVPSTTPPVWGPVVWTGDRLLGVARSEPYWSLVEWDPATDVWSDIPMPDLLREAELVWTGDRAVFPNAGLAFDPSTAQWWRLDPAAAFNRSASVILWAGDRVLMMGGWPGGPSEPIPFGKAYVPTW